MNFSHYLPALALMIGTIATALDEGESHANNIRGVGLKINDGTPTATSSSGVVNCIDGDAYNSAGTTRLGRSCMQECNDGNDCCGGSEACDHFTGVVARDGSCMGDRACFGTGSLATVGAISGASCVGDGACYLAGYQEGTIGDISQSSCVGYDACAWVGYEGGTIGDISGSSCIGDRACNGIAIYGGTVVGISEGSCIGYYACNGAGTYGGEIGSISGGSCAGDQACDGLGSPGSTGNLNDCCNDGIGDCRNIRESALLPETCTLVTVNLPATSTTQLVHGICVKNSLSPMATSSRYNLHYTAVPFSGEAQAWDDRSYVLKGVETVSKCIDGIFLRSSLTKSIPSGTEISITVSHGSTVCVFFENSPTNPSLRRNGGWPYSLDTEWSIEEYPDFGWDFNGAFQPFETRCYDTGANVLRDEGIAHYKVA